MDKCSFLVCVINETKKSYGMTKIIVRYGIFELKAKFPLLYYQVRRKTPLPQELLYADGSVTPLLPLPENPEEEEGNSPRKEPPEVPPKPQKKGATQGVDSQMMPPPRTTGMMKMSSSSNLSRYANSE